MAITCPSMALEAFWHMPFSPERTGRVTSTLTSMRPGQWEITWVSLRGEACRQMLASINVSVCKDVGCKFRSASSVWMCLRRECVYGGAAAVEQMRGEKSQKLQTAVKYQDGKCL